VKKLRDAFSDPASPSAGFFYDTSPNKLANAINQPSKVRTVGTI
jgi:hypothetical protein